jgi:hypothetical protein
MDPHLICPRGPELLIQLPKKAIAENENYITGNIVLFANKVICILKWNFIIFGEIA